MNFKLVQSFSHNVNKDPDFRHDYVNLLEGSLKDIDEFTTKYEDSEQIRLYFKDKLRDQKSSIVILYNDESNFERKMKVLYKDEAHKKNTVYLQNNLINYLEQSVEEEGLIRELYDDRHMSLVDGRYYPNEKTLVVLQKYPYLLGANVKYGFKTFPKYARSANKYKLNPAQLKRYERFQFLNSRLSTHIEGLDELVAKDEARVRFKKELVGHYKNHFNSLRKQDNDYLHYVLRRLDSNFSKQKDFVNFSNMNRIDIKNADMIKGKNFRTIKVPLEQKNDPEFGDPFYYQTQGNNFDEGDLDYKKILEEEERLDKLANKRFK